MRYSTLEIEVCVSPPFQENTYLAHLPGRLDCLVVDPGFGPDAIVNRLTANGLRPAAILVTHGHCDHIAGISTLKERWPDCPIVIGREDADKLTDPRANFSVQFGEVVTSPPADQLLDDGETYEAAGIELQALAIPGHSRGHVVFIWHAGRPPVVFGGDVLFSGSVGRTDVPDGDFAALARGIHAHLFTLPDDTIVLPGHGRPTTVGAEKRENPYVGAPSGYRPPKS